LVIYKDSALCLLYTHSVTIELGYEILNMCELHTYASMDVCVYISK